MATWRSVKKKWYLPVLLLLFLLLCYLARSGHTLAFETAVYHAIIARRSPVATAILTAFTHLGDAISVIVICLVLMLIPGTRKTVAFPTYMALGLSVFLNQILKKSFQRARPADLVLVVEKSYSFPSGHAMNNGTLYLMLILFTIRLVPGKRLKSILCAVFAVTALLIGVSRVYLGAHYMSDVLAGWILSILIVELCMAVLPDSGGNG